ncbi:MAG: tRNA pseudouridine(38-40) synthase TruA [Pseudomonadota bacterium]
MSGPLSIRHRIEVEYDGGPFAGWQRQDTALSVQQVLEEAGEQLSGGKAPCYGAGRTDAGVHAIAMTAHIDLAKPMDSWAVMNALNAIARPHPIAVLHAEPVDDSFHARFSCIERRYVYKVIQRRAPLALEARRFWQVPRDLNVAAMQEAANHLVGHHDFTTFRSAHCQSKSPVKSINEITLVESGAVIEVQLRAQSFLHNQVRSIVGTLERVGSGRWQPNDVKEALEAKDRSRCGPVAPAHGLYFEKAIYDEGA